MRKSAKILVEAFSQSIKRGKKSIKLGEKYKWYIGIDVLQTL